MTLELESYRSKALPVLKMRRDFDTPVPAPLIRVSTPMLPPPRSESWDFGQPPLETEGRVHAG
jgi:hypothetical protein